MLPVLCDTFESIDVILFHAVQEAVKILHLKIGDNIVLTGGQSGGQSGNTNMIKVETVKRV